MDAAEAVERIVPRRQLLFENGDVIIVRIPSGLNLTGRLYQLFRIRGSGPIAERFVSFEHAAAAGDQVAAQARVRLFYVDSDSEYEVHAPVEGLPSRQTSQPEPLRPK